MTLSLQTNRCADCGSLNKDGHATWCARRRMQVQAQVRWTTRAPASGIVLDLDPVYDIVIDGPMMTLAPRRPTK